MYAYPKLIGGAVTETYTNSVSPSFKSPCTSLSANLTTSPALNSISLLSASRSFPTPFVAYHICSEAS
nr:MAG TPA: hypothetical protein [Caudoviricetes sp.]